MSCIQSCLHGSHSRLQQQHCQLSPLSRTRTLNRTLPYSANPSLSSSSSPSIPSAFLLISEKGENLGIFNSKTSAEVLKLYNPKTHFLRELGKKSVVRPLAAPSKSASSGGGGESAAPALLADGTSKSVSLKGVSDKGGSIATSVFATILKIQPIVVANAEKAAGMGKPSKTQTKSQQAKVKEKEIEINTSISDHDLSVKTKKMREWLKAASPPPASSSGKKPPQPSSTHLKVTLIDKSKAKVQATSNSSIPELYKKVMDAVGDCAQPLGPAKPLLKNKKLVFTLQNK